MTYLKFLVFISLVVVSFSCEKKDIKVNTSTFIGTWRLKALTINNIDGNEINPSISNSTILQINDNKRYYRNYVHGTWSLSKNKLILNPDELNMNDWEYKIIELTDTNLTLQINKTDIQYGFDFDQFESNEVLNIIEKYSREE